MGKDLAVLDDVRRECGVEYLRAERLAGTRSTTNDEWSERVVARQHGNEVLLQWRVQSDAFRNDAGLEVFELVEVGLGDLGKYIAHLDGLGLVPAEASQIVRRLQ